MFYEQVLHLCNKKGITVFALIREMGMSKANGTYWKNGKIPKFDTLKKVADYFNVTTDFLLTGNDTPAVQPPTNQQLFTAEDIELLLKIKNLPPTERKEVESFVQFKEVKKEMSATIAT